MIGAPILLRGPRSARRWLAIRAAVVVGAATLLIGAAAVTAREPGSAPAQQPRSDRCAGEAALCPVGARIAPRPELEARADPPSTQARRAVAEAGSGR